MTAMVDGEGLLKHGPVAFWRKLQSYIFICYLHWLVKIRIVRIITEAGSTSKYLPLRLQSHAHFLPESNNTKWFPL